ncbi:MAG: AsmA-like C-terminal domain-containing protein [Candidatus Scalindua sp.]|nr:AsmA-like C-terminal domain-containing protein [Candidatus Scalindua sp.]
MARYRKIGIGVTGFLLSLLIICNYLSSPFINSGPIKRKIQAAISQKFGGQVEYLSVDLSLFPFIHARVDQVTFFLPGKIKGRIETLDIFPEILPLFAGKVRIREIDLESPDFDFALFRDKEKRKITKELVTLDMIKDIVPNVLFPLFSELPQIQITIENGTGNITEGDETVFDIKNIQAEISSLSKEIDISIKGRSGICNTFSVEANIDRSDFKGNGVIQLGFFQPQSLVDRFLPDTSCRISESIDKLSLHVEVDGPRDFKAEIEISPYSLKVKKGDRELFLKSKKVKSSLHIGETETEVSLTELELEHPHLTMRGKLVVDHETRQINLELTGRDIDIHSVREEALASAGDNEVVRKVFQIVKGGRLSDMMCTSKGRTLADLGNMETLIMKAAMREGDIVIPGLDLQMEDVTGDFVVNQGILEGDDISARLEDAYAEEGRISIGLKGSGADLHVEAEITAAAEQIPPLLNRFVGNRTVLREINRVKNVKGSVAGKLLLGGHLDAINVEADINKIDVSAHYKGVPFPLHIKEGGFHYDRETIGLENLGGTLGSSPFSELSARISLGKDAYIEVQSGKILAFLKEIYPWISSFEKAGRSLEEVKSVSGILQVVSMNLKGPLTTPESWFIEAAGEAKDLLVDTTLFADPLEVKEGIFKVVDKEFFLTHSKVKAADSSLRVSGVLSHNAGVLDKADITFHGEMGQKSLEWIEKRVNLPSDLSVRPPLSIQKARITWKKDYGTSFVSSLTFQNDGPEVSVDMFMNPEGIEMKSAHIQDGESSVSFRFDFGEKVINFGFTGNLSHTTTDKIFLNTPFAKERIEGDIKVHIRLDRPEHSTFQGTLKGKDLPFSWNRKVPLHINDISLHGEGKSVRVGSLLLTLSDNRLSVQGDVTISEDGFLFDLDTSAGGLDWGTIRKILPVEDKREGKGTENQNEETSVDENAGNGEVKRFWDIPVKGTLGLDAESFTFERYTWKQLRAHISFENDGIKVDVTDADLCGISCEGALKVDPEEISLDFQLLSRNQDVDSTFSCFGNETGFITGRCDMKAQAVSQGAAETLVRKLQGNFEIAAKKGRIYRYGLIARLFAFLNLTEILRGKVPDVVRQGFGYKSITANGEIENGILKLEKMYIDGSSMKVTGYGKVDLPGKNLDLKVLVSPFKTVDFFVKKIPVVGKILGGSLVSIPVGITGDIENPKFSYISHAAVGQKLLDITKGALKVPVKIIKLVIPGGNRKEGDK